MNVFQAIGGALGDAHWFVKHKNYAEMHGVLTSLGTALRDWLSHNDGHFFNTNLLVDDSEPGRLVFETRTAVPSYVPPTGQQMIDRQLCFHCNYWEEMANELRTATDPRRLIINHRIYLDAGYSKDARTFLGFGGREFRYRRVGSDEVILTNNLWSGATLPPEYWAEFPDTAEFVN